MGVGRFFCVALPFALTVGSIIFLLIGALAGVADKGLYVFRVDVENLSIDEANYKNAVENFGIDIPGLKREAKTNNITAENLGLSKSYDVSLWGFCETDFQGKRTCLDPKFDWASHKMSEKYIEDFGSAAGVDIELPKEFVDALKAFSTFSKWTQIIFCAAFIALAAEIILGVFANCSRIMSCLTWVFSGIAAALVGAAALMATLMGSAVVGAVKSTAKFYGAKADLNTKFLGVIWIAVAFAIGASLFWVFTICCCAPKDRSSRKSKNKNRHSDGEKLLPTGGSGYAPIGNDPENSAYYNQNQSQSQYGAPRYPSGAARSDLAYEPYSHRA